MRASVLKCCRMNSTSAKTLNDMVTKIRGSTLSVYRATQPGQEDRQQPTGASTSPASVAVYPCTAAARAQQHTFPEKKA